MTRITVTTHRSNSIVRKGATVEVEWTPRIANLIESGRLTALTVPPSDPTKAELVAAAEARGVYVAKSWSKQKIAEALDG